MSCRRDEIVSSNWCFKRCCWKVLILAAKPPGVDTLKRYRKSRHPVQNEMKRFLSELKTLKSRLFRQFMRFLSTWFEKESNESVSIVSFKSGVDFRGRHVELRLTELDYTLLLDTVVPRLMITIESRFGWLAPLWFNKKRIHTQGAHWYDHRSPMAYPLPWSFLVQNKSCHFKFKYRSRVFIELTWKSLWRSSHYSFGIVQGDSDSQYSNHAVGFV